MKQALKRIFHIIRLLFVLFLIIILCINIYMIVQRTFLGNGMPTVFGYTTAVVVSDSMEEYLYKDDMVLVKRQSAYHPGDVILFEDESGLYVTHRIVAKEGEQFITRGDANNIEDPSPTSSEKVVGKVIGVYHSVGKVMNFFLTPLGIAVLVIIGYCILSAPAWVQGIRRIRSEKTNKREGRM